MVLNWDFIADYKDEGLWIRHDESINSEHAAIFVQAFLKAFDLPTMIDIQVSHGCDKDRLAAFGGHACLVTKDTIDWIDPYQIAQQEVLAHQKGESYFACNFVEKNTNHEHCHVFLMRCSAGDDVESKFEFILTGLRKDKNQNVSTDQVAGGMKENKIMKRAITFMEFEILKQYLRVL